MSPESFRDRFQVEARIFSEVLAVDSNVRKVTVRNLRTGETYTEAYDKLILSPGAKPIIPPLPGADSPNVFTLRNIPDMLAIKDYIGEHSSKRAVVVGGGYIGIEMAENLKEAGLSVAIVEMQDHLMASLDFDMAAFVHNHLREKGIDVYLSNAVKEIQSLDAKTRVILAQGSLNADLVILAIGVRSDTDFLKDSGIALNERGGIIVNDHMMTSNPDIYAVGDAAEISDFITGQRTMVPLAGPANKQGRIAADNICGIQSRYEGTQGSSIIKVFDLTVAATGLNEKRASKMGLDYEKSFTLSASHAKYYPLLFIQTKQGVN